MNILIFLSPHPLKTSGIVGFDLFCGFQKKGHNVKLITNYYDPNYPEGIKNAKSLSSRLIQVITRRINKLVSKLLAKYGIKSNVVTDPDYFFHELNERRTFYRTKKLLRKAKIKPDVIFLLFAKDFINAKNIYELYRITNSPIYWLMYDMAPFTGGCHYAWDCKGYQNTCGNCPGLFSSDPFDISYQNLLYKKKFIEKTNIHILAGSEWQYTQAKHSALFKDKTVHKVLLSVDSNIFQPADKVKLRLGIGIPINKRIVFFGAIGLNDKRKGFNYLVESLRILKEMTKNDHTFHENSILLLIAGSGFEGIVDTLNFEYHYMGVLDNTFGIASAYQIADIFVCPSIEDSGPTMINQSIMCGTPVVAFEMGVSLDLVITGETGYLAKLKDSQDLAKGIFEILKLDKGKYDKLSENCRGLALKCCSSGSQIDEIERIIN